LVALAVQRRLENPYKSARVGYEDLRVAMGPTSTRRLERLAHYYLYYWVGGAGTGYNPARPEDYALYADLRILSFEGVKSAAELWERRRDLYIGTKDTNISAFQKQIMHVIHRRWREGRGEWPKPVDVILELHSKGDVLTALQKLPMTILASHFSTIDEHLHTSRLQLRFDGLLIIAPNAEPALMAKTFPVFLEHFKETEGQAPITAEAVAAKIEAPLEDVLRLKDLYEFESWTGVHIIPQGNSWVAAIGEPILKMEGISTLKRFLAVRKKQQDAHDKMLARYQTEEEVPAIPVGPDAFERRNFHPEAVSVAAVLFRQGNWDEAVEAAFKRLTFRVKKKSGRMDLDGTDLMLQVFNPDRPAGPALRLNPLQHNFQRNEQRGWMQLFAGVMGALRNPLAHPPGKQRLKEQAALDLLTVLSLLYRRLDKAVRPRPSKPSERTAHQSPES